MNKPFGLDELRAKADEIDRTSTDWLQHAAPIVLYGAGNFGRHMFEVLKAKGRTVAALVDGKLAEPTTYQGVPVYPLSHPQTAKLAQTGCLLVITVFNYQSDWNAIVADLLQRGFTAIITAMEIFDALPEIEGPRYWISPPSFYLQNWPAFVAGENVWHDETSREMYRRLLWFRLGRELTAQPAPQLDCQYAPRDLPRWPEPIRLLDGGACVAEALQTFHDLGLPVDHYIAFEPDLANYAKMALFLEKNFPQVRATLFPCGLGAKTEALSFAGGLGAASAFKEGAGDKTVILRGAEALRNQPVSVIKLDIEGAEIDALTGLLPVIRRDRPGLAISAYHNADDILRIPALVQSWNLSYRLHLRQHAWNTFDSVLYALPE